MRLSAMLCMRLGHCRCVGCRRACWANRRIPRDPHTFGVLGLFHEATGPMASADLGVAQAFADLAALALAADPG
jgi:hypothetical protein